MVDAGARHCSDKTGRRSLGSSHTSACLLQDAVDDLKGAYGRVSSTALAPINLLTGAVRKAQQATASVSRTASRSSQEALPASSQQDTDTVRQQ